MTRSRRAVLDLLVPETVVAGVAPLQLVHDGLGLRLRCQRPNLLHPGRVGGDPAAADRAVAEDADGVAERADRDRDPGPSAARSGA